MASSPLISLPKELVADISDLLPVDSLLNFALTCSAFYRLVERRLAVNKKFHLLYRFQHDRLPLTVPDLLRVAFRDTEAIWHLREFKVWGSRKHWSEWVAWEDDHGSYGSEWSEPIQDYTHLGGDFWVSQEMEEFRDLMTSTLHLSNDAVKIWMEMIREGWDMPLKGLLFALAPRLDKLTFLPHNNHEDRRQPLEFLCQAASSIHQNGAVWPPGFQSLREITVGTVTDLRHLRDTLFLAPSQVAPLFLLPNIKILEIANLGRGGGLEPDFHLPANSSSVEVLNLPNSMMSAQAWETFINAPRRLLRFTTD